MSHLSALGVRNGIDAHLHPWSINNLPAVIKAAREVRPDLAKDYSPGKVVATAKESGFTSVILAHARDVEDDAAGEAQGFIEAAREYPEIKGAVVGIDLLNPEGTEAAFKELIQHRVVRAGRMLKPENAGVSILSDERARRTLKLLGDLNIRFDLLIRCSNPGQLEEGVSLVEWLAANSKTVVIGDHLLKPLGVAEGRPTSDWLAALARLEKLPNFFMKISGLPGEVPAGTQNQIFRPFYDAALNALGPDRLMFGSDHPVSYGHVEAVAAVADWLTAAGLTGQGIPQKIFGDTARKAYGL